MVTHPRSASSAAISTRTAPPGSMVEQELPARQMANHQHYQIVPALSGGGISACNHKDGEVHRVRRWKVFPGRNRFFCDGRIIMAKQISVFYFTVSLLVGTCVLFFIFDCPYLSDQVSPAIPAVGGLLFVFVLFALLRTSFSDPGIIPRATPEEAADVERQIVPKQSNSPTVRPPPRTKQVTINDQQIKLKYCFTCKIFRPPRASHCSLCDNCVERFDHHCPWVGNCVGKRNYRFFYMFIVSLAFLCIYVFACIITHFILLSKTMTFVDAVKASPVSVLEMVICFFSVWSILGLAGFHTYLIMSNLTTNEDIKGSFSKRNNVSVSNPYSRGDIFRNCFGILCSPVTPSLIHARSFVYCGEAVIAAGPVPAAPSNNTGPVISRNPALAGAAAYPVQQQPYGGNYSYQAQYLHEYAATEPQQYGDYTRMLKAEGDVYLGHTVHHRAAEEVMMVAAAPPPQQQQPPPVHYHYQEKRASQPSPCYLAEANPAKRNVADEYPYLWPAAGTKTPPCSHHHHHQPSQPPPPQPQQQHSTPSSSSSGCQHAHHHRHHQGHRAGTASSASSSSSNAHRQPVQSNDYGGKFDRSLMG